MGRLQSMLVLPGVTGTSKVVHSVCLLATFLLQLLQLSLMNTGSPTTLLFEFQWTITMLVVPALDLFYTFDTDTQDAVIANGQSWAVWVSSAVHAYLLKFNYDLVFGDFSHKFDLDPSQGLKTCVVANTIVGICFVSSLLLFTGGM